MGKHLVFIGGGHAHLTALVRLKEYIQRGHKVTFISPSPYQYYSGMAPVSPTYAPGSIPCPKLAEDSVRIHGDRERATPGAGSF
jgi:NADH dehydrogenase FAD-containing subunit